MELTNVEPVGELITEEVSLLRLNAAGLIDSVLFVAAINSLYVAALSLAPSYPFWFSICGFGVLLCFGLYRLFAFSLFDQTIGMWIMGVHLLDSECETPDRRETMFAAFFLLINGLRYYKIKRVGPADRP